MHDRRKKKSSPTQTPKTTKHHSRYPMLVGSTGTGKTAILSSVLRAFDPDSVASTTLSLSSLCGGRAMQALLERPLEKRSGARYGPPGGGSRRLVYFVDDLNMPLVDKYDTQPAVELARQYVDYGGWYDLSAKGGGGGGGGGGGASGEGGVAMREVQGCQLAAAMNPSAGSFTITPRMQRHFCCLAVHMPGADVARAVYGQVLSGHLESSSAAGAGGGSFSADVAALAPRLVDAAVELHRLVASTFLPSAVRFHYQFSMRELSAVVAGGLCRMSPPEFSSPLSAARLWAHECERVFRDRLMTGRDAARYDELLRGVVVRQFADLGGPAAVLAGSASLGSSKAAAAAAAEDDDAADGEGGGEAGGDHQLLFASFVAPSYTDAAAAAAAAGAGAAEGGDTAAAAAASAAAAAATTTAAAAAASDSGTALGPYREVASASALRRALEDRLAEYNDSGAGAAMELVLFRQAAGHVSRVARVLSQPRGHALLVGIGGSGKQSLARLAAGACGFEVAQLSGGASFGAAEFRAALLALYLRAGGKNVPTCLLLADAQLSNEAFLVYVNDLLAGGYTPDLFAQQEDRDAACAAVRADVKALGLLDTPQNCWQFFLERVRQNLRVVMCMSPVGERLSTRARRFPALVSCTTVDWLQGWPEQALISVARRFLADVPGAGDDNPQFRDALSQAMAHAHSSVAEAGRAFAEATRRKVYVTPKSYLELIALYKSLLARKRAELSAARQRLEGGVAKIAAAGAQVADLKAALEVEMAVVAEKKQATDMLIESIGRERGTVDEAVEASRGDEEAAALLQAEVACTQAECARDLEAAEPVIAAAEAALNSLDKASLGELKSFGSPAAEVVQVVAACMVLCSPGGKPPRDLSWAACKKFMGNVDAFLRSLTTFDRDNVPTSAVEAVETGYIKASASFSAAAVRSKSAAAAGLCDWVVNICRYHRLYLVVAPKRTALADSNRRLEGANKKLGGIRAKVKELQERVRGLEEALAKATEDKNAAAAQADKTARKASLADRLVTGLAGENARWAAEIRRMEEREGTLVSFWEAGAGGTRSGIGAPPRTPTRKKNHPLTLTHPNHPKNHTIHNRSATPSSAPPLSPTQELSPPLTAACSSSSAGRPTSRHEACRSLPPPRPRPLPSTFFATTRTARAGPTRACLSTLCP
jgi:hypothetical protein